MTLFDNGDARSSDINKDEFLRLCRVEEYALDLLDFLEVSGVSVKHGSSLQMYIRRVRKAVMDGHSF